MKISNSKKQLAEIIHENGGWREGNYAVQDKDDSRVWFMFQMVGKPSGRNFWPGVKSKGIPCGKVLPNWHQTVLSRDEYFHLYQEQGLEAALNEPMPEAKPTIEQLAADYRNLKDYAGRKQQEADAAKADAEVKLAELVAAGKALGLVLSVTDTGPELVITDWRDLLVGDRIWVGDSGHSRNCPEGEYEIAAIDSRDSGQPIGLAWPGGLSGVTWPQIHKRGWRFIRRPAQGDTNA